MSKSDKQVDSGDLIGTPRSRLFALSLDILRVRACLRRLLSCLDFADKVGYRFAWVLNLSPFGK
jgi:hypothetical protein